METYEFQIQGEHTSGLTAKHYHGEAVSTLNAAALANIPEKAVVSSVKVVFSGKISTGDTYFYVGFTTSSDKEPGYELINSQLKTSKQTWTADIPFSGRSIVAPNGYSRINVWASSGIIMKKYTCYDFRIIWTYTMPATYTVNATADTGGTVTGNGTYYHGETATLTAIPDSGYKFTGWNDGNTNNPRYFTYDTVYTPIRAHFLKYSLYAGSLYPKDIYVGTTKAKAIFLGTTRKY